MMRCKEYIFKLTSGQLAEAAPADQLQARMHWLMCRYCRAFTANDRSLDEVLATMRRRAQGEDARED